MSRTTVGRLVIDLTAGTVNFDEPIDRSSAKLRNFGSEAERQRAKLRLLGDDAKQLGSSFERAGTHGVTNVQAISASLRTLEGGFGNNIRAAERFIGTLGPLASLAQKAFPVAGGIAVLGVFDELYQHISKVTEAVKTLQDAPHAVRQAFTELNGPLTVANDQLRITNDRLDADIAKLQGKPANGLAIALDEAKLSADRLAESLDKDLGSLEKLLREKQSKNFELLGLSEGIGPIADQIKEFHSEVDGITARIALQVPTAHTKPGLFGITIKPDVEGADAAISAGIEELRQKYIAKITDLRSQLPTPGAPMGLALDAGVKAEAIHKTIDTLTEQFISAQNSWRALLSTQDKAGLEAQTQAIAITRPYEEKLNELRAQVERTRLELNSIGQGTEAQSLAKSFGEALEIVTKLNAELARKPQLNTGDQIESHIAAEATKAGISPNIARAVGNEESGFKQFDKHGQVTESPAGALGVMQLMPDTAKDLGVNPKDTSQNIQGGIAYLAQLFNKYKDWTKALEAYNWGPRNVDAGLPVPPGVQKYAGNILANSKTLKPVAAEANANALSDAEKQNIFVEVQKLQSLNAEKEWQTKLQQILVSAKDRAQTFSLLTSAIGQGYEAQENATVQQQLFQQFGKDKDKLTDKNWLAQINPATGQPNQVGLTEAESQIRATERAQHGYETGQALDELGDRIELEAKLALVEKDGAEAVRIATLEQQRLNLELVHGKAAGDALAAAESKLSDAQTRRKAGEAATRLQQETSATNRVTAAVPRGAEAVRQAQLENKIEDIRRSTPAGPEQEQQVNAERANTAAQRQSQVLSEAFSKGSSYQTRIEEIDREISALNEVKRAEGDNLAIETSLKDLEQERAHVFASQVELVGTARDGLRAYFSEMATEGVSAAKEFHDVAKNAFDSLNDSLAKLASNQQVSWGSLFQSLSAQLTKFTLQNIEANVAAKFLPHADQTPRQQPQTQSGRLGGIRGALASILGGGSPYSTRPMDEKPPAPGQIQSTHAAPPQVSEFPDPRNTLAGKLGSARDGQSVSTALFVTTVSGQASSNPSPAASALPAAAIQEQASPSNPPLSSDTSKSEASSAPTQDRFARLLTGATGLLRVFGGFRAEGGTVSGSTPYIVGEKGPELFVPPFNGAIIPNHRLNGLERFHPDTFGIHATGPLPKPAAEVPASPSFSQRLSSFAGTWDPTALVPEVKRSKLVEGFTHTSDVTSGPPVLKQYLVDIPLEQGQEAVSALGKGDYLGAAKHTALSTPILPGFLGDVGPAMWTLHQRAAAEFDQGRYVESLSHSLLSYIPLLGPNAVSISDKMLSSKTGSSTEALGELLGFATAGMLPFYGLGKGLDAAQSAPAARAALDALKDESGGIGTNSGLKRLRALDSYKPSTREKQVLADESESRLSRALGIPRTAGNAPFDLLNDKYGIEVKTLVDNGNDKITMHPESLQRKLSAADEHGINPWTVVVDQRGSKPQYYYRSGLGSFRIGAMRQASTLSALKSAILDETGGLGPGSGKLNNLAVQPDIVGSAGAHTFTFPPHEGAAVPGDFVVVSAHPDAVTSNDSGLRELFSFKPLGTTNWPADLASQLTEHNLTANNIVGYTLVRPDIENPARIRSVSTYVAENFRRQGIATHMYDAAEQAQTARVGEQAQMTPSTLLSDDARAFWRARKLAPTSANRSAQPPLSAESVLSGFAALLPQLPLDGQVSAGHTAPATLHGSLQHGDASAQSNLFGDTRPQQPRAFNILTPSTEQVSHFVEKITGKPFEGFRAQGGDASSDSSYIVGEDGPELFVPREDGFIVPNKKLDSVKHWLSMNGGGTRHEAFESLANLFGPHSQEPSQTLDAEADANAIANKKAAQQDRHPEAFDNTKPNTRFTHISLPTKLAGNQWKDFIGIAKAGLSIVSSFMGSSSGGGSSSDSSGGGGFAALSSQSSPPGAQSGDVLARDPSGLIVRTQADTSSANNATSDAPIDYGNMPAPPAIDTGGKTDPLQNFDWGSLPSAPDDSGGSNLGQIAMIGATAGLNLLSMLLNRPKNHHFKSGSPYYLPSFSAYAEGGTIKAGQPSLVGEKGPERFVSTAATYANASALALGNGKSGLLFTLSSPFMMKNVMGSALSGPFGGYFTNGSLERSGLFSGRFGAAGSFGSAFSLGNKALTVGATSSDAMKNSLAGSLASNGPANTLFPSGTFSSSNFLPSSNVSKGFGGYASSFMPTFSVPTFTAPSASSISSSFGSIGKTFGGGGSGILGGFSGKSFGGFKASGGAVDPSRAYIVGEAGPELWTPPSSGGTVVPSGAFGGGQVVNNYFDARGTDAAAVEQRIRRGMEAAHNASVRTSFKTYEEYLQRTPQRLK